MAKRTTMNVSLTEELSKYVEKQVRSGAYTSASEVVREGLRLMRRRESARRSLRREIMKGVEQARRGELIDGEKVMKEARARLRSRLRSRKAG